MTVVLELARMMVVEVLTAHVLLLTQGTGAKQVSHLLYPSIMGLRKKLKNHLLLSDWLRNTHRFDW